MLVELYAKFSAVAYEIVRECLGVQGVHITDNLHVKMS